MPTESDAARAWRKRSHRLRASRDALKIRNREKATKIKALEGKASDLEVSRTQWKKKYEDKTEENDILKKEIEARDKLIEIEKQLRQQEAKAHLDELTSFKKK